MAQQRHDDQPAADLLDSIPVGVADLTRLPEDHQRRLFDAFHLQVRYNALTSEIILRASIHTDTAPALAAVIDQAIDSPKPPPRSHPTGHGRTHQKRPAGEAEASPANDEVCDAQRAPGWSRTTSQTTSDQRQRGVLTIRQRLILP